MAQFPWKKGPQHKRNKDDQRLEDQGSSENTRVSGVSVEPIRRGLKPALRSKRHKDVKWPENV